MSEKYYTRLLNKVNSATTIQEVYNVYRIAFVHVNVFDTITTAEWNTLIEKIKIKMEELGYECTISESR